MHLKGTQNGGKRMSTLKNNAPDIPVEPTSVDSKLDRQTVRRHVERLEDFSARVHGTAMSKSVVPAPQETDPALVQTRTIQPKRPITRVSLDEIELPKKRINANALMYALKLSDIIWVTAIITLMIWNGYVGTGNHSILAPVAAGILGTVMFVSTLLMSGAHRFHPAESYNAHMKKVFFAGFSALGAWLGTAFLIKPDTFLPDALAFAGLLAAGTLFVLHSLYYLQVRRLHEKRALAPTIVMLGATESARRIIEENARSRELNIKAIFDDRLSRAPRDIHGVPVVGKVSDLMGWDELPYVDRIVVTLPGLAHSRKQQLVEQVRLLPNRIAFVVDEFETLDHIKQRISQIAHVSMQDLTGSPKSGRHTALKRIMDVIVSSIALVLGSPFLLLIALLVKLESPGPAIFKQKRQGFNNREFEVYKFRSLRVEVEDKNAAQQVVAGDTRVTRLGRIIRKTSIDELPQLVNVLKGDMSLVGPRPHAVGMRTGNIESYKLVDEYAHRHKVKPGMTGWAQINGSRGPLHDAAGVARRVELDVEYIERASIWFDVMIMLKTIPCLLGDSENIR